MRTTKEVIDYCLPLCAETATTPYWEVCQVLVYAGELDGQLISTLSVTHTWGVAHSAWQGTCSSALHMSIISQDNSRIYIMRFSSVIPGREGAIYTWYSSLTTAMLRKTSCSLAPYMSDRGVTSELPIKLPLIGATSTLCTNPLPELWQYRIPWPAKKSPLLFESECHWYAAS